MRGDRRFAPAHVVVNRDGDIVHIPAEPEDTWSRRRGRQPRPDGDGPQGAGRGAPLRVG